MQKHFASTIDLLFMLW